MKPNNPCNLAQPKKAVSGTRGYERDNLFTFPEARYRPKTRPDARAIKAKPTKRETRSRSKVKEAERQALASTWLSRK